VTPDEAFLSYLKTHDDVIALFGSRIYSNHLPESPTLPAIAIGLRTAEHLAVLSGSAGIVTATFEVRIWCETFRAAVEAGDVIRQAVQGYRGAMGTLTCLSSILTDDQNSTVAPDEGSSAYVYAKSLTYKIKFREAIPSFP